VKAILAGAHAVQMVSALLLHGPGYLGTMVEKLVAWMEWSKMPSVETMRGRVSLKSAADPSGFERANYIHAPQLEYLMGRGGSPKSFRRVVFRESAAEINLRV
jgi:dihydroorotate dehydrogenase (fumarate)